MQSLHTLKKEQIIQVNWITSGVTVLPTKTTSTAASKYVHFLLHNCSSMTLSEKEKIKENGVISRLSMITQVNIILNRTVVDSDWRFDDCAAVIFIFTLTQHKLLEC